MNLNVDEIKKNIDCNINPHLDETILSLKNSNVQYFIHHMSINIERALREWEYLQKSK